MNEILGSPPSWSTVDDRTPASHDGVSLVRATKCPSMARSHVTLGLAIDTTRASQPGPRLIRSSQIRSDQIRSDQTRPGRASFVGDTEVRHCARHTLTLQLDRLVRRKSCLLCLLCSFAGLEVAGIAFRCSFAVLSQTDGRRAFRRPRMRLGERPSGQSWAVRDRQGPCRVHRPLVPIGPPIDTDTCTGNDGWPSTPRRDWPCQPKPCAAVTTFLSRRGTKTTTLLEMFSSSTGL